MADLKTFLETHTLCKGVGKLDAHGNGECCSISALNWCAGRGCTDTIAPEDSAVIGRWVIAMQDNIASEQRNSERWKNLLLRLPGLGQDQEAELNRLAVAMDAMWERLASLQPIADSFGYGAQWLVMCKEKTSPAAYSAADAAEAAEAADAAYSAAYAAYAAYAADAADAARAADYAAYAAAYAARAADAAARAAADFDPCTILERMIES